MDLCQQCKLSERLLIFTWTEARLACTKLRLELNLDTSLLEAEDTLVRSRFTLVICDWALVKARFALVTAEFALVNAKFALVTCRNATVTLEKAEEVAILAFCCTTDIVCEAEFCADLIPLEAEIEACWSCWENVALSAIIVREISTVALLTDAAMRLEQSWGLFCRSSRRPGGVVMSAS